MRGGRGKYLSPGATRSSYDGKELQVQILPRKPDPRNSISIRGLNLAAKGPWIEFRGSRDLDGKEDESYFTRL